MSPKATVWADLQTTLVDAALAAARGSDAPPASHRGGGLPPSGEGGGGATTTSGEGGNGAATTSGEGGGGAATTSAGSVSPTVADATGRPMMEPEGVLSACRWGL